MSPAGPGPAPGRPRPLAVGPLEVWPPVVLAPMAGITNAPFRRLCRSYEPGGLFVSEMITARGVAERNGKTLRMARFADDEPVRSIQLYGTDPAAMGEAVRFLVGDQAADHIDLNFGCPVGKVTRKGGGAALPVHRALFRSIVRAAVQAAGSVPVTVKLRIGVDDRTTTFLDAGRIAADEGAAALALHARTAEQHYSGRARWAAIADLKQAVAGLPVLGNGDIWQAADALAMVAATGCDGVVVGRGCLGRPWLFRDLALAFAGRPVPPPPRLGEVTAMLARHARLLAQWVTEPVAVRDVRKHVGWYLQGYPVGGEARRRLTAATTVAALEAELARLDPDLALPAGTAAGPRGKASGPIRVTLPDGWLATADDPTPVAKEELDAVSGG
ncbi:MAG TPA: tRNA dihydrouridine synthase DusB [Acidimicrobiales bacterium]|nr:tRNA dihydrouridine synthase DusB [Acidimicrobiales bacterium]